VKGKISLLRALRLVTVLLLLAASAFMFYKAARTVYTLYPNPSVEDMRVVDPAQALEMSHFDLVEEVCYDAVTRFPAPEEIKEEEGYAWVLVSKARAAACVS